MSKSYKKTPYCGDSKGKCKKRIANHKVRQKLKNHNFDCDNGSAYRKMTERWDICDYYWITTWKEYWKNCIKLHYQLKNYIPNYNEPFPNKKEEYRKWLRFYHNK